MLCRIIPPERATTSTSWCDLSDILRLSIPPQGLGLIIIKLSFLLRLERPIELVVPNSDNVVYAIKQIFQIPDHHLRLVSGPRVVDDLDSDELTVYSGYFFRPKIKLFGHDFVTGRRGKSAVALAMHHGTGLGQDLELKSMPFNKYATQAQYDAVFHSLTQAGYDVITMNNRDMDIEQKTYVLNELCEFVVGYEGGLMHLAHVLKIPCFVLPWRYNDMGHEPQYPGIWYETHRYHGDTRTWFLRSVEEFVGWSAKQLSDQVDALYADQGNNILFDPHTTLDKQSMEIHYRPRYSPGWMDLTPRFADPEARQRALEFIRHNLPDIK